MSSKEGTKSESAAMQSLLAAAAAATETTKKASGADADSKGKADVTAGECPTKEGSGDASNNERTSISTNNARKLSSSNSSKKGRSWEDSYNRLVSYKGKYMDCKVPRDWKEDPKLAEWVKTQRKNQKSLSSGRLEKLNKLGFTFGNALKERNDAQWEASFQKLKTFAQEHGTANPPRHKNGSNELPRWCVTQRQNYRRGLLSEDRKSKLESIGFVLKFTNQLSKNGRPKDDAKWREHYDKIVAFHKEHGHCNVPKKDRVQHEWCYTQRKCYKEGRLEKSREKLLEEIGFVFSLGDTQRDEQWQKSYESLLAFHKQHGHVEVPRSGPRSDRKLLKWLWRQREAYKNERLSNQRKDLLKELGFDFVGDLETRKAVVEEENWKIMFEELQSLKAEKGNLNDVTSVNNTNIVDWIKKQKAAKKKGKLSSSRIALLEELGLTMDESKAPPAAGGIKRNGRKHALKVDERGSKSNITFQEKKDCAMNTGPNDQEVEDHNVATTEDVKKNGGRKRRRTATLASTFSADKEQKT